MASKKKVVSDDAKEIGANIRRIRKRQGLTQEDLAGYVSSKCSTRVISQCENGIHEPTIKTFLLIASALNVSPCELLPKRFLSLMLDDQEVFIESYKRLNKINRKTVDEMVAFLLMRQNESNDHDNMGDL